MSILDISNWTINEINNSINTFKDTSLTDIGMVNCDIDSINIVGGITTATLWIDEDIGIDEYTGIAPFKIYKEEKLEIKLNSPLLEEDTIEVIDGKLCHVHRWKKIFLNDESIKWAEHGDTTDTIFVAWASKPSWYNPPEANSYKDNKCTILCVRHNKRPNPSSTYKIEGLNMMTSGFAYFYIKKERLVTPDIEGFKQWLQENPIVVVYRMVEPYYEDITPLQSSIILKTFLESSMTIDTILPIETKLSYRTNVPSISTLSTRATELAESDNVIHNLMNIIDDEVDE